MKKRDYEKPTMLVVQLKHQSNILVSSPGDARLRDYDVNDYDEE